MIGKPTINQNRYKNKILKQNFLIYFHLFSGSNSICLNRRKLLITKKIGTAILVKAKANDSPTKVGIELSNPTELIELPSGKIWIEIINRAAINLTKSKIG